MRAHGADPQALAEQVQPTVGFDHRRSAARRVLTNGLRDAIELAEVARVIELRLIQVGASAASARHECQRIAASGIPSVFRKGADELRQVALYLAHFFEVQKCLPRLRMSSLRARRMPDGRTARGTAGCGRARWRSWPRTPPHPPLPRAKVAGPGAGRAKQTTQPMRSKCTKATACVMSIARYMQTSSMFRPLCRGI